MDVEELDDDALEVIYDFMSFDHFVTLKEKRGVEEAALVRLEVHAKMPRMLARGIKYVEEP